STLCDESLIADGDSKLFVLWRLGARCSRHRKEPAWVVGEQRQLPFEMLRCLVSPAPATCSLPPDNNISI
ncbi:hypothetical protein Ancab_018905, partial [Ancistrocladus abbreviatus]